MWGHRNCWTIFKRTQTHTMRQCAHRQHCCQHTHTKKRRSYSILNIENLASWCPCPLWSCEYNFFIFGVRIVAAAIDAAAAVVWYKVHFQFVNFFPRKCLQKNGDRKSLLYFCVYFFAFFATIHSTCSFNHNKKLSPHRDIKSHKLKHGNGRPLIALDVHMWRPLVRTMRKKTHRIFQSLIE